MIKQNSYSVILPTLNEAGHIKSLISDISKNFYNSETLFEIIVVDDSSSDGTVESLRAMDQKNLTIHTRVNKKKSLVNSLNEGIAIAKYENIIWMDADYSHPPEYILDFINMNKKDNLDAIVCSRFLQGSKRYYEDTDLKPVTIDLLSIVLNKACKFLLFKDLTDYTSGFICVRNSCLNKFEIKCFYGDYFVNLISYLKNTIK